MINHMSDSRMKGYSAEFRKPLEYIIEDFLLRPGVSFLDPAEIAEKMAKVVRSWSAHGGVMSKTVVDAVRNRGMGPAAYHTKSFAHGE